MGKFNYKNWATLLVIVVLFFSFGINVRADAPVPTKTYPTDGLTNLSATVTLKWDAVDGAEKGYHYGVWLYETNNLVEEGTIDGTEVTINLSAGTKYFWNVESCWSSGLFGWGRTCGGWGTSWIFTTQTKIVSQICGFSLCNGYNQEPCVCGQTPISGGYCCSTYNNGEGAAFDPLDCTVRLKCPNVPTGVKSCDQSTECQQQFSGNCICGTEMINNQFCCSKLSKGYYNQNDCQNGCNVVVNTLSCQNSVCQKAEDAACLCGSTKIEAGQFCCAASGDVNKSYRYSQTACQRDVKCSVQANTCGQLYGSWCDSGLYCNGTDLTAKASDKEKKSGQVCCFGNCTDVKPSPPSSNNPILPVVPTSTSASNQTLTPRTNCPTTGFVPCGNATCPCRLCDFFALFDRIVKFILFTLVPPIAVLMIMIIGAMYFLAAGDTGKLEKAKALIKSTVIGLLIIYGAYIIVNTFFVGMGVATWTGLTSGWFKYPCQ